MSDITTAFWGMVINNYDETDLALVRQGYPDHIRKITFTLEKGGEKGTPHIQAFVRLFRQQRMSYMRKLFPGANFKSLTSEEYRLNAESYATKQDATAESPSVIMNNPFPDPVDELVSVIEEAYGLAEQAESKDDDTSMLDLISLVEERRVRKAPRLAKFYVGATYKNVKKQFLPSLMDFVLDRRHKERVHTHTHNDEKLSHQGGITNADDCQGSEEDHGSRVGTEEGEDCEGDEEDQGSGSEAGSESDDSGCSESDAESED